jgi:hypothetical protein
MQQVKDADTLRAANAHKQNQTNGRKNMNGSRLNEHRTKRTPILHWVIIVALAGAALIFGANLSSPATTVGTEEDTVALAADTVAGFNTCMANKGITPEAAQLHAIWQKLIDKIIAFEKGEGPALNDVEIASGSLITEAGVCGTFNGSYPVLIIGQTTGYFLFIFEPGLGYGEDKWLIYREGLVVR